MDSQPKPDATLPPSHSACLAEAELVVQNGLLSGARRLLAQPVTVIGSAPGCDVRLQVKGVNAAHCLLLHTSAGIQIRDLNSDTGTLLNGEAVTTSLLRDGDLVTVGPFRFRLRMGASPHTEAPTPENATYAADGTTDLAADHPAKEALRIQAAAVAAQQALLFEEEIRLHQRRLALEQQETQLAAHLEEKRQRLAEIRDQAREARIALQQERKAHEQCIEESNRDMARARRDVTETQLQAQRERQRVLWLWRRLKHRFHRQWAAQRAAWLRRDDELRTKCRQLEHDFEQLEREKAAVREARLRCNGEIELGHRQLEDAWVNLRQQQLQWEQLRDRENAKYHDRLVQVDQREAVLAGKEREQHAEKQRWAVKRHDLEKEIEGLECRILNQRRKLVELRKSETEPGKENSTAEPSSALAVRTSYPAGSRAIPAGLEVDLSEAEIHLRQRFNILLKLSGELANQRVLLAEQAARLAEAQETWRQEQTFVLGDFAAACARCQERENELFDREQALSLVAGNLALRHQELVQGQRHQESSKLRLDARVASWEEEYQRRLEELQGREDIVERQITVIGELRQKWHQRQRRQGECMQAERDKCLLLSRQLFSVREEWIDRTAQLERRLSELAEQTLALEQLRQEILSKASHRTIAEKRLERLRKSWASRFLGQQQALAQERQQLALEFTQLQDLHHQLHQDAADQESALANGAERQSAGEHNQALQEMTVVRFRQEIQRLQDQRLSYERQLQELNNTIERFAVLLIEENATDSLSVAA